MPQLQEITHPKKKKKDIHPVKQNAIKEATM